MRFNWGGAESWLGPTGTTAVVEPRLGAVMSRIIALLVGVVGLVAGWFELAPR
jgi:hypothetical protein